MARRPVLLVSFFLLAGLLALLFVAPPGPRSLKAFDPDRVADLEVDMWQAYYNKERVRLFRGLLTLLREQNRYSWARASQQAYYFAKAASTFGSATSGYDRVLPDLTKGYDVMRNWTNAGFDPETVARAELAWWAARRVPEQSDPANVGRLMALVNASIYGVPAERVSRASALRAEAAALRDRGGANADWNAVSTLLHLSYRQLYRAVQ
ncbi:MAG TPA: hypothetical protein VFO31_02280 [Vicinamibacterales bacterium]|nr:hypothetical protein [Vicinamibacterales bacterium]